MSSSTSRKKSTSQRTKRTYNKRNTGKGKKTQQKDNSFLKVEIVLLLILAFSIILLLSNFGIGGVVGNSISTVAFGVFGIMSYVLAFILFFGCALFISNKDNPRVVIKIISGIVLFLLVCAFTHLISKAYQQTTTIKEFYEYSSIHKSGGGIVGGGLSKLFASAFGTVGAYVIDITLIIISIVIITEKSFLKVVKKSSNKVYSTAKSTAVAGNERLKEKALQRQIEAENRRINKKVEGVSINTSIETGKKAQKQDIHEITMDFMPDPSMANPLPPDLTIERNEPIPDLEDITLEATNAIDTEPVALEESFDLEDVLYKNAIEEVKMSDTSYELESQEMTELESQAIEVVQAEPVKNKEKLGEEQTTLATDEISKEIEANKPVKEYVFPPLSLLKKSNVRGAGDSDIYLRETAAKLQQTLQNFGVRVNVTNISCGPTVTRYELQPEMGVKVSKIVSLSDDIKLNLAAADIRIEAPIPGKAAVGIEVPNKENSTVMLRDLLESAEFKKHSSNLAFAAGKDIGGQTVVTDIAKMPHLLIAGSTGSGKSVCINTLIMSILYKAKPDEVKLIMIDPKVVELSVYNGIPHLFIPVVTDPKKAAGALNWAVAEMTTRYKKFADLNVRDLKGYNEKIQTIKDIEEENKPEKLPQIVIIVDELADLMMVAPGEVEDSICRLAQLARAAGIHLIIATQRPSVNVITGLIKANMPSRIAFAVSSGVDSRTIIDMNGAEKLLGKGDMLFYPQGYQKPARVQGAFVSDKEVSDVVAFLTKEHGEVEYSKEIESSITATSQVAADAGSTGVERDVYFIEAGKFIIEKDKASIGMLQRVFKVGFNRAARIMDQLCDAGVVGEEEGTKPRKVLMSLEEFEQFIDECV
ncbi:FtsK/SpoIIIE family DNA translocase [Candidatus Galacturonibacter soehngenii]|uniref:DNA translocase FtsK n=1 Tax=Candidatus Galacturonatibacter soehngenii TaxID=2307010 RepID=A0A7V7UCM0_9FIRM|nr:DNA translocase FtsK [Candidatus Galacturonibacter soehngenii]KAB1439820.1 DNA translocase FtsK [Candidatus Galacturonibacter soehngenii]